MAYHQVGGPSYQQLDDSSNPAAQAYARQALAHNGIHVPPGADAAAMWRQFSAQRGLQRNEANFMSQGEAPDMGVTPGQIPPSHGMEGQPGNPQIGALVGAAIAHRLPDGGYNPAMAMNGLMAHANNQDWRSRIAAMAEGLNNHQFHTLQGGPAESAMNRLLHVHQATRSAQAMAKALSARRPSRKIPQGIMRTRAY